MQQRMLVHFLATLVLIVPFATASEVKVENYLSSTWSASSNGPWIEFNSDGSVKRMALIGF